MYANDKIRYEHSMNYIQYEYNKQIRKKDRHVGHQVSGLGIMLPPLQQEVRVLSRQNTLRIDHYPVSISATACGPNT